MPRGGWVYGYVTAPTLETHHPPSSRLRSFHDGLSSRVAWCPTPAHTRSPTILNAALPRSLDSGSVAVTYTGPVPSACSCASMCPSLDVGGTQTEALCVLWFTYPTFPAS